MAECKAVNANTLIQRMHQGRWNCRYDPESNEHAKARNTNLNEDLGKIDYIFSDKTGTLTSNEMQLREIAIKGVSLGTSGVKYAGQPV